MMLKRAVTRRGGAREAISGQVIPQEEGI